MTAITPNDVLAASGTPVVAVRRRTIDTVLVGAGAVVALVLAIGGGLLTWGASFSNDYVHDELSSQNIVFPDAEALTGQGREDLLSFAGARVDTGKEAEAYASYIDGHLAAIADGQTYADLSAPERAAKAAVTTAQENGAPADEIAALQAEAGALTGQRTSLFQGETLRGLLLSAYAWSTVGQIAQISSYVAFGAAAVMAASVRRAVAPAQGRSALSLPPGRQRDDSDTIACGGGGLGREPRAPSPRPARCAGCRLSVGWIPHGRVLEGMEGVPGAVGKNRRRIDVKPQGVCRFWVGPAGGAASAGALEWRGPGPLRWRP
ncbi:MAG: hypothetical protein R2749_04780 [Acidimicrobiales bacterium]